MANSFKLHILAADHVFYEGDAISLIIPTTQGYYGIMAHHRNMSVATIPGMMTIKYSPESKEICAISNGIVKVEANEVVVLCESIERPEEIDENRAKRDAEHAREIILQKQSIRDFKDAQTRLARAINRLNVLKENEKY